MNLSNREHYKITEFNKRRLSRGEKYCLRADVTVNGIYDGWIWLKIQEISEIKNNKNCSIEVSKEIQKEIIKIQNWEILWNEPIKNS